MKYLQKSKIPAFRKKHCPKACPITKASMQDNVLDHCHSSGAVRGVLHRQSNAFLGKIENAWKRYCKRSSNVELAEALRNMADYLDAPDMDILHPVGATQLISKFRSKNNNKKT
ncbi:MAG: endonuclease domain-containing protein, partial [Opitutales bacterium]